MSAHTNPDIWDEPGMRRALPARDISTLYRLLCDAGLSQTQISKLTGQSQSEVSEILSGRRVLSYAVLERICSGLSIPRGHVGLAYADAEGNLDAYPEDGDGTDVDSEVDDEMISRRFLGMSSAALLGSAVIGEAESVRLLTGPAGKLDKRDIGWISAATDRFRELESEHGGIRSSARSGGTTRAPLMHSRRCYLRGLVW